MPYLNAGPDAQQAAEKRMPSSTAVTLCLSTDGKTIILPCGILSGISGAASNSKTPPSYELGSLKKATADILRCCRSLLGTKLSIYASRNARQVYNSRFEHLQFC